MSRYIPKKCKVDIKLDICLHRVKENILQSATQAAYPKAGVSSPGSGVFDWCWT